jgi:hypothetical protein
VKAYKIELLVIDFDGLGEQGIVETIASRRWPNDCISPSVEACQEADIGVWTDDHPLNRKDTASAEYARLFAPAPQAAQPTTDTPAWLKALPEGEEAGAFHGQAIVFTDEQLIAYGLECGHEAAATSPAPAVVPSDLSKAILALEHGRTMSHFATTHEMSSFSEGWREALSAAAALAKQVPAQEQDEDTELLNWFDQQREAYGTEGYHEGNRWIMDGPFYDLRHALRECKAYDEQQRAAQLAQSADTAEGDHG